MSSDIEFRVLIQTEAAKKLLAQLAEEIGDDQQMAADVVEGETGLIEAIAVAVSEIDECDILVTGLKAKEQALESRRKSIEKRSDRMKAMIEQAMIATEQWTIRVPSATLSLRKKAPDLVVLNEADIPSRFWIEQERPAPKLDRKALAEAIKEEPISGVTLNNGSISLSVRRK